MTIEEAVEKLKTDDYNEAYAFFLEEYKKTGNIKCKYYITMVDFHDVHENDLKTQYNDLKSLLVLPKEYHESILLPLISVCLDLSLPKEVIKYCHMGLEEGISNSFLFVALSRSMLSLNYDLEETLFYCDKAINDSTLSTELAPFALETKINVCLLKKDTDNAFKAINQFYLRYGSLSFIDFENLRVSATMDTTSEKMEELYDSLKNTIDDDRGMRVMFDYYYDSNNIDKTLEYADLLLGTNITDVDEKFYVRLRMVVAYQSSNRLEEAKKILLLMEKEEYRLLEVYYHLGITAYLSGFKKGMLEAITYFKKGYDISKTVEFANYLGDCYYELGDLETMKKYIIESVKLGKKAKKRYYFTYLSTLYYIRTKHFFLANRSLKAAYKAEIISEYKYHQLFSYIAKNPTAHEAFLRDSILQGEEDSYICRRRCSMYDHGEYGSNIDKEKALYFGRRALELEKINCNYSVLGNALLDDNKEEAASLFNEGSNRYFNELDCCPCSVAFAAFIKFNDGLKEEAYELVSSAILKDGIKVSENVANLYGFFAAYLDKEPLKAYTFLKGFIERRYQVSTAYTLIYMEKKLNIKRKKSLKYFKKCLKYASLKEKEYYGKKPFLPFLNNF